MSENTNATAGSTETISIFTREDGTQFTTEPFSLAKTKEIADRFRGERTINVPLPVVAKGADGKSDLDGTLRNLRAFVAEGADFAEVLVAKFVGQGIRLDIQKEVKEFLAPRDSEDKETIDLGGEAVLVKDAPTEDVLAHAQVVANEAKVGAPRKRGTGAGKGKVAAAEAKTAKTANVAVEMYRALPAALRAAYRDQLLGTGALTVEQLDAVDAETAVEQPKAGKR